MERPVKMSTADKSGGGEFMLFGVRVVVDSMRKSVSLNNLSQYVHPQLDSSTEKEKPDVIPGDGYASADDAVPRASSTAAASRERRRGVPWTEEEHKLFLLGLQKVGKGDWRGISRNFVKTRTPTQVASHAQKYFLRRSNQNRRRRRSSLFDITTDSVPANPINNDSKNINGGSSQSPPPMEVNSSVSIVKFSVQPETTTFPSAPIYPVVPSFDLNENSMTDSSPLLSLNLSLSMTSSDVANSSSSSSSRHSAFQNMRGFSNGDGIISVA